jgi:hypothetical protein
MRKLIYWMVILWDQCTISLKTKVIYHYSNDPVYVTHKGSTT